MKNTIVAGTFAGVAGLLIAGALSLSGGTAAAESAKAKEAAIEDGRGSFNNNCSHCHGENAVAEDSFYNLPLLMSDKSDAFFFKTVSEGMEDKGMPPWKGVIEHKEMAHILAFLRGVEKEQGLATGPGKKSK
jgi:mono/diheme cytochrome c family protein